MTKANIGVNIFNTVFYWSSWVWFFGLTFFIYPAVQYSIFKLIRESTHHSVLTAFLINLVAVFPVFILYWPWNFGRLSRMYRMGGYKPSKPLGGIDAGAILPRHYLIFPRYIEKLTEEIGRTLLTTVKESYLIRAIVISLIYTVFLAFHWSFFLSLIMITAIYTELVYIVVVFIIVLIVLPDIFMFMQHAKKLIFQSGVQS